MDFTDDIVLALISEFKKHPVLWDSAHKYYKINSKKKTAWNEIAKVFKVEVEVLKKKMVSVTNSYRRERAKVFTKISGTDVNEVYKSTWFAYNALSFMHDKYQSKQAKIEVECTDDLYNLNHSNEEDITINDNSNTNGTLTMESTENTSGVESLDNNLRSSIIPSKSTKRKDAVLPLRKPNKKIKVPSENETNEAWHTLQSIATKKPHDQFDAFGKYIAERLRQMDSNSVIYIKKAINDFIFQSEIGTYSSLQQPSYHSPTGSHQFPTTFSNTFNQSSPISFISQPSPTEMYYDFQPSPSSISYNSQPSPSFKSYSSQPFPNTISYSSSLPPISSITQPITASDSLQVSDSNLHNQF